jgi:hypothetical protein
MRKIAVAGTGRAMGGAGSPDQTDSAGKDGRQSSNCCCGVGTKWRVKYDYDMQSIRIRFPDDLAKRRALGFLAGRFSFTSYPSGEMIVIESALPALAREGISFTVEGPTTYSETIPALRTAAAN